MKISFKNSTQCACRKFPRRVLFQALFLTAKKKSQVKSTKNEKN